MSYMLLRITKTTQGLVALSETLAPEKMGDEHNPLTRLQSGDDLILVRDPMHDIRGQIARAPEVLDVLLGDGGGLPLALGTGPGHCWHYKKIHFRDDTCLSQ